MASKSSNSTWGGGLGSFINSPRFGKAFKALVVGLVLMAAIYGVYTLISQRFSSAASQWTWYYNTKSVGHTGGQAGTYTVGDKGKPPQHKEGTQRAVWVANLADTNKLVWWGPYVQLQPGRQYLGCFYYAFGSSLGSATLDIVNNYGKNVLHSYDISGSQPRKSRSFNRTCLAFFVPGSWTHNNIELRFKYISGTLYMRETKISKITKANTTLNNQNLFRKGGDNTTVLADYGSTL